jgi:hypothetical protein
MANPKKTIDLTPKWENLVTLFVCWLESGTKSQKQTAITEIRRLATIADALQKHKNCGKLRCDCGQTFSFS